MLDRKLAGTLLTVAAVGLFLCAMLIPVPSWTRAQGVVWLSEQSQVRALEDGFVVCLLRPENSLVNVGDALIETEDSLLRQQVRLLEVRLRELRARLTEARIGHRSEAQMVGEEIAVVQADLARARERAEALILRSPSRGRLIVPHASDLPGRFLHRGDLAAYVADPERGEVRVAVQQDAIGLVRNRTQSVELRLASWPSAPILSRVLRQVPAATYELPSPALGSAGGGAIPLDPREDSHVRALEKVFILDLELADPSAGSLIGQRVEVRFNHGPESLWRQWYRSLRQLFLSHVGI